MENKNDLTDGQSFLLWLWKQTYGVWIIFMIVLAFILLVYKDFKAGSIVIGVGVFGVLMMYRIYKQMQKGESS